MDGKFVAPSVFSLSCLFELYQISYMIFVKVRFIGQRKFGSLILNYFSVDFCIIINTLRHLH